MTPTILYTRHVSQSGRVTYQAAGIDLAGIAAPGVWLVHEAAGGRSQAWVSPLCPVPVAIHAACLATMTEAVCDGIGRLAQERKTYSRYDLARVALQAIREASPPKRAEGQTTQFYVCAGCGTPVSPRKETP